MNSLNDLLHSHEMYDDFENYVSPNSSNLEYPKDPSELHSQPISESPNYIQRPNPTPPSYSPAPAAYTIQGQHRRPYYPAYHKPTLYSHSDEQTRQTIHAMMQEIAQMQRRLGMLMSSCQTMMERTYVSHEYHHIAHYHEHLARVRHQQYTPPSPSTHTPTPSRSAVESPYVASPSSSPPPQQVEPMTVKEGVFDGVHMISADGDMYTVPPEFASEFKLIEGDIMQAMVYGAGQVKFKLAEPTARENIMGILSTHSGNSPYYIVQTATKAYQVLRESVESAGATPGKQVLLTVPVGGESEWAVIDQVFS